MLFDKCELEPVFAYNVSHDAHTRTRHDLQFGNIYKNRESKFT